MNNYRTYINFRNRSNIKISRNDDDIYTREMALKKKKENKLEEIRKKEIEEELSELTYKPKINKKSEILSKNKMPIYKRLKEIEIEKNIKMEKIKQNIGLKENNINQTNQKFNEKDFNNWLISNDNWNTKKIMKLNNIKNEVIKEEKESQNKNELKPNPLYVYWCPDCCICGPFFNHDELINQKEEIKIKTYPKSYILIFETALTTLIRCSLLSFKHIKAKKYKNFFENILKNEFSILTIKFLFSIITGQNRTYFRYIFIFYF